MQIFKTIVTNGAIILPIDTISYGDGLWLVPHWIATGDASVSADDTNDTVRYGRTKKANETRPKLSRQFDTTRYADPISRVVYDYCRTVSYRSVP
jgi:hypothetical protein